MPTPAGPKIETRCGSCFGGSALPQRVQDRELERAADDPLARDRALPRRRDRANRQPRLDRVLLPFRDHRIGRRILDRVPGRQVRLLTHDDAVHGGRRLQPGGRVHHVACDHRLAERGPRAEGHDGLARVDGDPDLQVAAGELADDVPHDERRAHGALCVVAVGERRSEHAHDRIADELLDDAAERLDLPPDALVVGRKDGANLLGIEPLGPGREPDEVDEDDGDDPPLVPRGAPLADRGAAREAEAGNLRVLLAAGGADNHPKSLRPPPAKVARLRVRQAATRCHEAERPGADESV